MHHFDFELSLKLEVSFILHDNCPKKSKFEVMME